MKTQEVNEIMKTALEKAKELLEVPQAGSIAKTVETATSWAIIAVAEQLARVATVMETRTK